MVERAKCDPSGLALRQSPITVGIQHDEPGFHEFFCYAQIVRVVAEYVLMLDSKGYGCFLLLVEEV